MKRRKNWWKGICCNLHMVACWPAPKEKPPVAKGKIISFKPAP